MRICTMFWRSCRRFADARGGDRAARLPRRREDTKRNDLNRELVPSLRPNGLPTFAVVVALGVGAVAQDSWPTYHGDFSGQRHSKLTQITPDNVRQLTLAWAFQTGQTQQIKSTPILVNGIIYITTPDNIWAI